MLWDLLTPWQHCACLQPLFHSIASGNVRNSRQTSGQKPNLLPQWPTPRHLSRKDPNYCFFFSYMELRGCLPDSVALEEFRVSPSSGLTHSGKTVARSEPVQTHGVYDTPVHRMLRYIIQNGLRLCSQGSGGQACWGHDRYVGVCVRVHAAVCL